MYLYRYISNVDALVDRLRQVRGSLEAASERERMRCYYVIYISIYLYLYIYIYIYIYISISIYLYIYILRQTVAGSTFV